MSEEGSAQRSVLWTGTKVLASLLGQGVWGAGKAAHGVWTSVDPDARRHLAQLPVLAVSGLVPEDDLHPRKSGRYGQVVILVHGLGGNAGNMAGLKASLRLKGWGAVYAWDFPGALDLDTQAQRLVHRVRGVLEGQPSMSVQLVAHSQGGVVAALALEDAWLRKRVERMVTLGSPLRGTHLARLATTSTTVGLRPGSAHLRRVRACLEAPDAPALTCFWSGADVMMLPPETATWPGARNLELKNFTHYGYLVHPASWKAVGKALLYDLP